VIEFTKLYRNLLVYSVIVSTIVLILLVVD
jgi:hypothetical protein